MFKNQSNYDLYLPKFILTFFILLAFSTNIFASYGYAQEDILQVNAQNIQETLSAVVVAPPSETAEESLLQEIAVIWQGEISRLKKMQLKYQCPNGEIDAFSEAARTDNAVLFRKDFTGSSEGSYTLMGIQYCTAAS